MKFVYNEELSTVDGIGKPARISIMAQSTHIRHAEEETFRQADDNLVGFLISTYDTVVRACTVVFLLLPDHTSSTWKVPFY